MRIKERKKMKNCRKNQGINRKQGRIHGTPVADGWAGAVMQKLQTDERTDRPADLPTATIVSPV